MGFTQLLKDTFTPYTLAVTDDGVGGQTQTWTAGTAFQGRLSTLSGYGKYANTESVSADKITVYATHCLYCDASVTLTETSKLMNGSRTFHIKSIRLPSNLSTGIGHQEVDLLEID
jgi:hypothetical protein